MCSSALEGRIRLGVDGGFPLRWILRVNPVPRHSPLLGDKAFASGQVIPLAAVTARVYSI